MDFKKILMGVAIVIILYLVITYIFTDSTKTDLLVMHDASARKVVDSEDLIGGNTANYSYSFWLYINTWDYGYGSEKVIFRRTKSDETNLIEGVLDTTNNNLLIKMAYSSGDDAKPNDKIYSECSVSNIPLQKWTNVIVTLNNKAIDIYLDGKLVKTCVLPGVQTPKPAQNLIIADKSSDDVEGTGFSGFLAKFRFYSRTINPREAYEIYKEGYGSGWLANLLSKYKIKFAFLKNNKEVNSISF